MQCFALCGEARCDGALGLCLRVEIECGLDDHRIAGIHRITGQPRNDPVDKIAGSRRACAAHDPRPCRLRFGARLVVDEAGIFHGAQNDLRARHRSIRVGERIEACRRLHAAGQHCGLGQRQLFGGLAEEPLRCRVDSIDTGAEINAVEIESEDLVLGVTRLQIQREHRFLNLAFERAVGIQKQILRQLLRQGRSALAHMSGDHVFERGATETDGIKTEVGAKATVLDGNEGVGHEVRQLRNIDARALR